jgi:hypothetical protein
LRRAGGLLHRGYKIKENKTPNIAKLVYAILGVPVTLERRKYLKLPYSSK